MENPLFTFTTQPYPPRQRFEVWREEVNAIFDITIREPESQAFNYRLATGYLGALLMGCGVWDGAGDPVAYRVKRGAPMIRRDGLDHYYLCLGLSHSIDGSAGRRSLAAGKAQIYILDLARELDCVITAGDTIILTIPRDLLAASLGHQDWHGHVLQGGLSELLADHMRALQYRLPRLTPEEIPHGQQATLALVAAALAPSVANLQNAAVEIDHTLFNRARRLIERHLHSAELTPGFLCKHLGISRAQLYRLFSQESGVATYIQQRRLNRARVIIQSDTGARQRVSALAFQLGFKSDAHFSRSFKQAFGYSPKEAREVANIAQVNTQGGRHTGFSLRTILGRMNGV
ncbi:helix-turn-helix domain-containing protein [Pseudomonas poae]|uniref:AraC family transcriptional regulator n=1 Tax=Pseudomonas poae TaxID=200451 RepID=A0A2S9ESS2_9PSED|nr:helix-turn-helix domain-containing protein [Pseudomonas poae]PRA32874.1 AraC family transcriptional regulator [Pseudomonas poae]PRC18768.1 AraC family transcriptional regulator [Pseudomonas poae]